MGVAAQVFSGRDLRGITCRMLFHRAQLVLLLALSWEISAGLCDGADPKYEAVVSYGFKQLTTQDGLPQNTVRFLVQSRNGYLWIGTSAGLARFDGLNFTLYKNEFVPFEGGDARIWDLGEDGSGKMWVRTPEGLACFDRGRWAVFRKNEPPLNGDIYGSCVSRASGIWLAMPDGLKLFDRTFIKSYSENDGLANYRLALINGENEDELWLRFGAGLSKAQWQHLDPRTGKFDPLEKIIPELRGIPDLLIPARWGGVWLCDSNHFARTTRDGMSYQLLPEGLAGNGITHASEDNFGRLWCVAEACPRVFLLRTNGPIRIEVPELPSRDLRSILAGQDGVVWIGTGDAGLIELRPRPFTSLLTTNSFSEKTEVFSICPGKQARLWFGTSDGLFRLQSGILTRFTNTWLNSYGKLEHSVRAVLEDRAGTVWFGVKNEGLKRLQDGGFKSVPEASCGGSNTWTTTSLLEDCDGQLWIGSEAGLVCRAKDGRFSPISHVRNVRVTGIQQGPNGAIWVGTEGAGVYKFTGKGQVQFTKRTGLSSDFATPLLTDPDGAVWLSTPNGLNRLGRDKTHVVTTRHGLPDNDLYSLLEDGSGFYWAACNRGIFRVASNQLHAVADATASWVNAVCFSEDDGLASTECNGECQPNAAITPDGRLWFSTTRGCSTIDSKSLIPTEVPPQVVIEEVLLDDELAFKDGAFASTAGKFAQQPRASFPAGRGRVLEIRYTANSFLNPKGVSFTHHLQGHDASWRDAGPHRVAFYTDLKPGNYRFEVKARNEQGDWSPNVASFAFSVAPHFWQTWAFYVGSGLLIIFLAVSVQWYRLRWQHRLLKLEEQRALANERSRIARDLHDDLGTALTGLALELDVVGRDSSDKPSLAERLRQTAKRTRDLAERMREVVWTVNPHCDTVSSFADFLEGQVEQFLGVPETPIRLDFPEDIPAIPLDAKARHHLALGVREALNNVIRHAGAKEVTVSLELADQLLAVRVKDNGSGFLPGETSGHGLANLRARMEEIGGVLRCISAPGEGTVISFELPLAQPQYGRRGAK